jgi:hypothetical protein
MSTNTPTSVPTVSTVQTGSQPAKMVEQRILLSQAQPGWKTTRMVETIDRVRLCPSGTELNDFIIKRLAERGIKRIYVEGHPLPGPSVEEWDMVVKRLRLRFSRGRAVPFLAALEKIVESALARQAMRQ